MAQPPVNEHLPLAVAAAITYHHLTAPQRPQFYDGEHLGEVLTRVAEVTIRRHDLRDAIVALKAKGFAVTRPS